MAYWGLSIIHKTGCLVGYGRPVTIHLFQAGKNDCFLKCLLWLPARMTKDKVTGLRSERKEHSERMGKGRNKAQGEKERALLFTSMIVLNKMWNPSRCAVCTHRNTAENSDLSYSITRVRHKSPFVCGTSAWFSPQAPNSQLYWQKMLLHVELWVTV